MNIYSDPITDPSFCRTEYVFRHPFKATDDLRVNEQTDAQQVSELVPVLTVNLCVSARKKQKQKLDIWKKNIIWVVISFTHI